MKKKRGINLTFKDKVYICDTIYWNNPPIITKIETYDIYNGEILFKPKGKGLPWFSIQPDKTEATKDFTTMYLNKKDVINFYKNKIKEIKSWINKIEKS